VNRFVTSDDLTGLAEKAFGLAKLADAARSTAADLDSDKGDIKTLQQWIKDGRKRLRAGNLTAKQRGKIEHKLEYHADLLAETAARLEKTAPRFSQAVSRIEAALCDLAAAHEALSTVHRFEHG
jgi:peptidoglycan hydrolase CwlO-like protein